MIEFFTDWYRRHFSDPQAVLLAVFLLMALAVVVLMGTMLSPLFAAIVIAYLLESPVQQMEKWRLPRLLGVVTVFLMFLATLFFLVLGLIPLLSYQITEFFRKLPALINNAQQLLLRLPELYPQFISEEQVRELTAVIRKGLTDLGQYVLSHSLATIPAIVLVLVYLIVVPLLVFFFLKDKVLILNWLKTFLPRERSLLMKMWLETHDELGNYVRGKFSQILIVSVVTYVVFAFMGFEYAVLLSVLVGLAVLVPYIGAAVAAVPVAFAGYAQWGWSADFAQIMAAFFIIQALDGNLLAPLMFSEAVNLHPVSIVVAVLVFGDLWGFWGLFFAIPLATLIKSLLKIWPTGPDASMPGSGQDRPVERFTEPGP